MAQNKNHKTMNTLPRTQFRLEKVKTTNNGGIVATYNATNTATGATLIDRETIETEKTPHPDMHAAFAELKRFVASVWQMDEKHHEFIEVTGVALSGVGENAGVIITAKFESGGGYNMAMNTHRIKVNAGVYGWEDELAEICERIETETWEYLYNGKAAQLQIPFAEDLPTVDPHVNHNAAPEFDLELPDNITLPVNEKNPLDEFKYLPGDPLPQFDETPEEMLMPKGKAKKGKK